MEKTKEEKLQEIQKTINSYGINNIPKDMLNILAKEIIKLNK